MRTPADPIRRTLSQAPEYEDDSGPKFGFEPAMAANNARQGVTGHGVRFVLAAGILGALAVFIWLIYWVY
jgi:hypothetical protein